MTTIKSSHSINTKRFASRGRMILGATLIGLATMACTAGLDIRPKRPTFEAQAEFGGVATAEAVATTNSAPVAGHASAPAEAGPAASNYAQSGGGSYATAEITTAGTTIAGRVAKGAPRFYAMDLAIGDSLSFKVYGRELVDSYTHFQVIVMEPDMVDLSSSSISLMQGPEKLRRETFSATASQQGRHYIKVSSSEQPVEYRIEITGVTQAAR